MWVHLGRGREDVADALVNLSCVIRDQRVNWYSGLWPFQAFIIQQALTTAKERKGGVGGGGRLEGQREQKRAKMRGGEGE